MRLEQLHQILPEERITQSMEINRYGNSGSLIVYPTSEEEICHLVKEAALHHQSVTIAGGNSKQGFGGLVESTDILLSLQKYRGIVEHSVGDLTLTVKSGTTIKEINEFLHKHNQMLPIDCAWPQFATIGGVISTNDSGPKRMKYGSLRDIVLGLRVVYPDGKVIRTGGKVVKNVAGYDMNKLFIGAMGTLGVISEVTLKLRPIPKEESLLLIYFNEDQLEKLDKFVIKLQDSILEPTSIEMLNRRLAKELVGKFEYVLAISFTDVQKAVRYQEEWIYQNKPQSTIVETLHGDCVKNWWANFAEISPTSIKGLPLNDDEETVSLKISSKNIDVSKIIHYIDQLQREFPITIRSHGGVGHGITRIFIEGDPDCLIKLIQGIREFTEENSGFLVITHMPLLLREQISVWGDHLPHLPLLKKIKHAIDPKQLLNHQRYVGGI